MPMTEVTGADREVWLSIDVTGNAFAYVVRGLEMFRDASEARRQAGSEGICFLLVSGKPLQEPVAWYGPVMNTPGQLTNSRE